MSEVDVARTGPDRLRVAIRPWAEDDLDLMRAIVGDPAMTVYLGGPETDVRIRRRHRGYLLDRSPGGLCAITVGPDAVGAGWAGYWELEHHGRMVWEAGLSVLVPWQGHGVGSAAFRLILERAAADGRHRFVHAFPQVANTASNAMCERVGFELVEETDIEFPKGHWNRCNDWRFALWADDDPTVSSPAAPLP
jgi:RimJ/RimL family protein N-acetyltransferase